jgi:hypothetical protein
LGIDKGREFTKMAEQNCSQMAEQIALTFSDHLITRDHISAY